MAAHVLRRLRASVDAHNAMLSLGELGVDPEVQLTIDEDIDDYYGVG